MGLEDINKQTSPVLFVFKNSLEVESCWSNSIGRSNNPADNIYAITRATSIGTCEFVTYFDKLMSLTLSEKLAIINWIEFHVL